MHRLLQLRNAKNPQRWATKHSLCGAPPWGRPAEARGAAPGRGSPQAVVATTRASPRRKRAAPPHTRDTVDKMIHAHDVEAELWRFVDDGDQPSPNDLWRCIQYTARKKATALPSSFTRDSEMHLVDQHMIDTTDRHLVKAFCEQFRPGATERDMQKPLFYLTPFITCSKCNSILFIDAANARCFGAPVPESVRLKRGGNETLAVCPGCAMTEDLQVGAHDFMEDIEVRDAASVADVL